MNRSPYASLFGAQTREEMEKHVDIWRRLPPAAQSYIQVDQVFRLEAVLSEIQQELGALKASVLASTELSAQSLQEDREARAARDAEFQQHILGPLTHFTALLKQQAEPVEFPVSASASVSDVLGSLETPLEVDRTAATETDVRIEKLLEALDAKLPRETSAASDAGVVSAEAVESSEAATGTEASGSQESGGQVSEVVAAQTAQPPVGATGTSRLQPVTRIFIPAPVAPVVEASVVEAPEAVVTPEAVEAEASSGGADV